MRRLLVVLPLVLLGAAAGLTRAAQQDRPPATSPASDGLETQAPEAAVDAAQSFEDWLRDLLADARARGYSDTLLAQTVAGIEPLHRVIASDRSQAELNPGFGKYLSSRLTRPTVQRGRSLAAEHRRLLSRIEARYGVQGRVLLAIWGLESHYGRNIGRTPIFRALATLAWEPRRADFFRGELFNALAMVDRGYIEASAMTGSWAGAMGQTQFMPSSYLAHAVDFDGDGRRDIWKSVPDALASIANYLKAFEWNDDRTWGREVRVSRAAAARIAAEVPRRAEGCYAIRNMTERIPLARWTALGVRRVDGGPLPKADVPAGLVDVGERQFLVYPNYDAILGYNCAHYYALTVGLLSDALN